MVGGPRALDPLPREINHIAAARGRGGERGGGGHKRRRWTQEEEVDTREEEREEKALIYNAPLSRSL